MRAFEINALNFTEGRKLDFLPPHFKSIEMLDFVSPEVDHWILTNLRGRYFRGKTTKLENNKITECYVIAFEDPKEATFFILGNTGQK
jgi:hypothetical protein